VPNDSAPDTDEFETEGEAVLFGFSPSPVRVTVKRRSRGWRVGGAARIFGTSVVAAPVMALLPPHAIWPIGVLLTGGFLARRRMSEHFTLVALDGPCPKCEMALAIKRGRLRMPHPLPCDGCHHESTLRLPEELLTQ